MKYKKPLVSIIVPVKNGAETMRRSLNGIVRQSYKNIEVIIVDNFSTDETPEIAKEFMKKDKRIKYFQKGPERSAQINYGVKKAKGKYFLNTNCDLILDKKFIELAVKKCEVEEYKVCNGHIKSETKGFWSKVKAMERNMYVDDELMETALFYDRKLFLKLGGYDERMVGVEEDFQHKLDEANYRTGMINSFQTHIDEIDSLKEVILKSYYYGLYDTAYFKKRPLQAFKKRFPIRSAFVKHFLQFLKHPDLFAGFIIFKIVQYTAGTIGLVLGLTLSPDKSRIQKLIYERQNIVQE